MSPIAPCLAAVLADPAWLAMDATARGYHIQLLLVAAGRTPAGTLPGHEPTLRRYLGLGSARIKPVSAERAPKALEKFLGQEGAPMAALIGAWWMAAETSPGPDEGALQAEAWAEHLWQVRWRPMVMAGWQEVDDALIAQRPELARAKGGYFSPVAAGLAGMPQAEHAVEVAGKGRKTSKRKARAAKPDHGANTSDAGETAISPEMAAQGHDLARWHDQAAVFSRWSRPLDEQARRSLWDVGVAAMTGPDAGSNERSKAKTLLGKMIKEHGEASVAEAVAQLSVRAVPVADAASFLAAMLRNKEEGGSPLEQKARGQRARVAL